MQRVGRKFRTLRKGLEDIPVVHGDVRPEGWGRASRAPSLAAAAPSICSSSAPDGVCQGDGRQADTGPVPRASSACSLLGLPGVFNDYSEKAQLLPILTLWNQGGVGGQTKFV